MTTPSYTTANTGTGMTGMDIAGVRQLGGNLQNQANQLDQFIRNVTTLIMQAQQIWRGPDATRFVDSWNSQFRPQLMAASAAVRRLGETAVQNAAEQEAASR